MPWVPSRLPGICWRFGLMPPPRRSRWRGSEPSTIVQRAKWSVEMLKCVSVRQACWGLALLSGAWSFSAHGALAAEIRLLCAAALQPAMDEIIPAFQTSSGHTVSVRFANISVNTDSVRRGEPADLVVVSPGQWTELSKEGKIDAETRVIIAKVGLGVFVKKGAPKPDIGTTEAFKAAFLNAGSIAIPRMLNNPVGAYATRLF